MKQEPRISRMIKTLIHGTSVRQKWFLLVDKSRRTRCQEAYRRLGLRYPYDSPTTPELKDAHEAQITQILAEERAKKEQQWEERLQSAKQSYSVSKPTLAPGLATRRRKATLPKFRQELIAPTRLPRTL